MNVVFWHHSLSKILIGCLGATLFFSGITTSNNLCLNQETRIETANLETPNRGTFYGLQDKNIGLKQLDENQTVTSLKELTCAENEYMLIGLSFVNDKSIEASKKLMATPHFMNTVTFSNCGYANIIPEFAKNQRIEAGSGGNNLAIKTYTYDGDIYSLIEKFGGEKQTLAPQFFVIDREGNIQGEVSIYDGGEYVNLPAFFYDTCHSLDCDALPAKEHNVDGDQRSNPDENEEDIDNDGIPDNSSEEKDTDGDGIPNNLDADVDCDGYKNFEDRNVDGDDKENSEDEESQNQYSFTINGIGGSVGGGEGGSVGGRTGPSGGVGNSAGGWAGPGGSVGDSVGSRAGPGGSPGDSIGSWAGPGGSVGDSVGSRAGPGGDVGDSIGGRAGPGGSPGDSVGGRAGGPIDPGTSIGTWVGGGEVGNSVGSREGGGEVGNSVGSREGGGEVGNSVGSREGGGEVGNSVGSWAGGPIDPGTSIGTRVGGGEVGNSIGSRGGGAEGGDDFGGDRGGNPGGYSESGLGIEFVGTPLGSTPGSNIGGSENGTGNGETNGSGNEGGSYSGAIAENANNRYGTGEVIIEESNKGARGDLMVEIPYNPGFGDIVVDDDVITPSDSSNTFMNIIKQINVYLWIAAGGVLMAMVIYAGLKYMTARGNQDDTKIANKTLLYAGVGFGVVLLAYVLVNLVVNLFN